MLREACPARQYFVARVDRLVLPDRPLVLGVSRINRCPYASIGYNAAENLFAYWRVVEGRLCPSPRKNGDGILEVFRGV